MTDPTTGRQKQTGPRPEPGPDIPGEPGPDIPDPGGPDVDDMRSEVPAEPGPEIPDEPPESEVPEPERLAPDVEEAVREQREVTEPEYESLPTDELMTESALVDYETPDEPTSVTADFPTPADEQSGETIDERLEQERPDEHPSG